LFWFIRILLGWYWIFRSWWIISSFNALRIGWLFRLIVFLNYWIIVYSFFRWNILFGTRISNFFLLYSGLVRVKHMIITNIDDFSFIFTQSSERNIHLFVRSSIIHFIREYFIISYFIEKIWRLMDDLRMMHFLEHVFDFISISICLILDYSHISSLFDSPALLYPPFPSLLQSCNHILSRF